MGLTAAGTNQQVILPSSMSQRQQEVIQSIQIGLMAQRIAKEALAFDAIQQFFDKNPEGELREGDKLYPAALHFLNVRRYWMDKAKEKGSISWTGTS